MSSATTCVYIRAVLTLANVFAPLSFTKRLSAVSHSGSLLATHAKTFSVVVQMRPKQLVLKDLYTLALCWM